MMIDTEYLSQPVLRRHDQWQIPCRVPGASGKLLLSPPAGSRIERDRLCASTILGATWYFARLRRLDALGISGFDATIYPLSPAVVFCGAQFLVVFT